MKTPRLQSVESTDNLKKRVDRFFQIPLSQKNNISQLSLELSDSSNGTEINYPSKTISGFLDFISGSIPDGDVYLFGGMLRDLALFGKNGFNSDIDLVVEGNWSQFSNYLATLNARKNKFGGYRLTIGDWPVDIWDAKETWGIKQGLVSYKGISSLTQTTFLNWDAILMNWRTKVFHYRKDYFIEINNRYMDIVIEQNPNPLGMVVRILRYIVMKDAERVSYSVCNYLAKALNEYTFEKVKSSELNSYGNNFIHYKLYRAFKEQSLKVEPGNEGFTVDDIKKPMYQLALP